MIVILRLNMDKRVVIAMPVILTIDNRIVPVTVAMFMMMRVVMSVVVVIVVVRVPVVVILTVNGRWFRRCPWYRSREMCKAAVYVHVQCRDAGHFPSLNSGYGNSKVLGDFRQSLSKTVLHKIQ